MRGSIVQGQCGADDIEDDWQVENNEQNKWFHMPGSTTARMAVRVSTA